MGLLEFVGIAQGRSSGGGSSGAQPPRSTEETVDEEAGGTSPAVAAEAKELRPLVSDSAGNNKASRVSRDHDNFIQRCMLTVDERVNVKVLLRLWGPRLEAVVRLMLVSSFLDDAFGMAMHFSQHVEQVSGAGYCPAPITMVLLAAGLLAQSFGSLCLLMLIRAEAATAALVGWAVAQPLLYGQVLNLEFMSESLSLIGGLLTLGAHLRAKRALPTDADVDALARLRLLGRVLLPAAYVYQAGRFFLSAFTLDETNSLGSYLASLSMFVVNAAVLVALAVASTLVAVGLKSRTVALLLALVNIGFALHQHPFFRFLVREGGEWKVDEAAIWMPSVTIPKGMTINDFDPWQVYDLHRYYFFLMFSTSGALLLLAQFGPGDIAVQKDEVLLPEVSRAKD